MIDTTTNIMASLEGHKVIGGDRKTGCCWVTVYSAEFLGLNHGIGNRHCSDKQVSFIESFDGGVNSAVCMGKVFRPTHFRCPVFGPTP